MQLFFVCLFVFFTRHLNSSHTQYNIEYAALEKNEVVTGFIIMVALQWRYNERDGVSNRQVAIVKSTVYSGADQWKYQTFASLASVWEIHRWPVNSPHKGPVTRKMFPFDDVIMESVNWGVDWPVKVYPLPFKTACRHKVPQVVLIDIKHWGQCIFYTSYRNICTTLSLVRKNEIFIEI